MSQPKLIPTENVGSFESLATDLAGMVVASGRSFDVIVVEGVSGAVAAVPTIERLDMTDSVAFANLRPKLDQRGEWVDFILKQMPSGDEIGGKNVLAISAACKTGRTLAALSGYLIDKSGALDVATGVLNYCGPDLSKTGLVPDYFVWQSQEPLIFPWVRHRN